MPSKPFQVLGAEDDEAHGPSRGEPVMGDLDVLDDLDDDLDDMDDDDPGSDDDLADDDDDDDDDLADEDDNGPTIDPLTGLRIDRPKH